MPRSTGMRVVIRTGLVLAGVLLFLRPSMGHGDPDRHTLTCGRDKTIAEAVRKLKPGDTLAVSGTCNENLQLGEEVERITLDGQGIAAITADTGANAITVTGRAITIRGFTITGGAQGIAVLDGGSAVIDGNTIQNAARNGIAVFRNASADIINNTIQNNPIAGIAIQSNSSARIGWQGPPNQRISHPNIIQDNGAQGIQVYRGSSAQIFTNTIRNNVSHGVIVDRQSQAEVGACLITGNGGDGIRGMRNASLDLGTDVNGSTPQFDDDTNTGTNAGFGVRCMIAGFVDGRIGTLTGTAGFKSFSEGCVDSSMP